MENQRFIVQPLEQRVIYEYLGAYCLDQLDEELEFDKEIHNGSDSLIEFLEEVKELEFKDYRNGNSTDIYKWAIVEGSNKDGWEEVWKSAMEKVGQKELYTIDEIITNLS